MKKTLLVAGVALLGLASCKKDYTCSCTSTVTVPEFQYQGFVVQTGSTTTSSASTIINDKKSDAETNCTAQNATTSVPSSYAQQGAQPTTTSVTCNIVE